MTWLASVDIRRHAKTRVCGAKLFLFILPLQPLLTDNRSPSISTLRSRRWVATRRRANPWSRPRPRRYTRRWRWRWGRAARHRNVVQIVEALYIAALELQGCRAASRLKIVEGKGTEARNRIEVFKDHYVVKEDAKSVVWRGAGFHDLIEKAQIVESARRSGKCLADGVKIGTSRTEVCAESIVGRRQHGDAKITSRSRRCGGPTDEGAGLKIAVNNEVGGSWSGSGDQQKTDGEQTPGYGGFHRSSS